MPSFCDVALPVPLDITFTYRLAGDGRMPPVVGGRVLVPFRSQRLAGVVTALHDKPPSVEAKTVIDVLDAEPVLDADLLRLADWIAGYYLAPLGEVFRTMLPLAAEVKREIVWNITEAGLAALHESAERGSSARSRRTPDEQMTEYRVLDYLAGHESARGASLRAATGAGRPLLEGMLRKKWLVRQDVSAARDARRLQRMALLHEVSGKLNANQKTLVETLAAAGGRLPVDALRDLAIPRTTLGTLVRRGVIEIRQEPESFRLTRMPATHSAGWEFNREQREALEKIEAAVRAGKFSVTLLYGVTGSGKTAVYLAAMQSVLAAGGSAILLVPEIGLTPAAAANLAQVFGDEVALLHSALSLRERAEQWHRIRRGEARIVVGTRSAVFAPVRDLRLIVVDEEQDSSYKQEETPRYHARDVAVMRAKFLDAAVVMGSATPSLESFYNAQQGKYARLELRQRVEQRPLPEVEVVDMRAEFKETGEDQLFSRALLAEVRQRLERGEQAIILLNRRGYSAAVLCRACGRTVECANCAIALTFHKRMNRLVCHYCGHQQPVPRVCPQCGSDYVYFLGSGSEKLEERLHSAFPTARIGRLDRDTVRGRHDFERILAAFHAGEFDLLVGTQMIAKGHDVHGVTLVGVVGADFALGFPDFRAAERTFQLLTQVAGRAGRGSTPGRVVLQTYFPEHYAIQFAARHDYEGFFEKELRFRRWMRYPPFTAVANVLLRSDKLERALRWAGLLGRWFESTAKSRPADFRVLGPAAAPILRLKRDYRYHFVLKSASRKRLNETLRALIAYADSQKIPRTNVIVDVDALQLL
ncbi:MAG TPA: primosomal protein N' [Terriglobales bacterium]|nr:primosomal protein N' [Terriglobales bacterium]